MQRALVILIAGALLLAPALAAHAQQAPDAPARSTPFPDVPKSHWAYDAVEQLRQRGILRGYPPETKAAPKASVPKVPAKRRPASRSRRRR